jgi:cysteine desulfuration protein SufE
VSGYPPRLAELVETFGMLERAERIDALIELADRFREVDPAIASRPFDESRKVPACESEAYVWAVPRPDGRLDFRFAVENPQGLSAKAMAVVLEETLSGEDLSQVAAVATDLVDAVFGPELSTRKSVGLQGMVAMVQRSARRRLQAAEGAP